MMVEWGGLRGNMLNLKRLLSSQGESAKGGGRKRPRVFGELLELAEGDREYERSVRRVVRQLERLRERDELPGVKIFFARRLFEKVGFSVVVESPEKLKMWQETFIEEGWVHAGFEIDRLGFELMYLYVKPKYRKQGYGSQLLESVLTWVAGQRALRLYAYVSERTGEARDFYRKHGAEVIVDLSEEEEGIKVAFMEWKV